MALKQLVKNICPRRLWIFLHESLIFFKEILPYQRNYKRVIKRLRKKREPLNVLFFSLGSSDWKYDSVFKKMMQCPHFNPIAVACPSINRGEEHMRASLHQCYNFFLSKGYPCFCAYNDVDDSYLDVHRLNPDIIFFCNPYGSINDKRYFISEFHDVLTCYVNYGFISVTFPWSFNLTFHQQLWRYYVECPENKRLIRQHSAINAKNVIVSGYPMYDSFKNNTASGQEWKLKDSTFKRVIWSPHHTIIDNKMIRLSTFLLFYDDMLQIAEKYSMSIQFAFKPHPLLKNALYNLDGWGKERTDSYYQKWALGRNTCLVDGDYVDLFNSSDAIINDSGSFMIEYLYTGKPGLYLNNYDRLYGANRIAKEAFKCWYTGTTRQEIESFLSNIVLNGNDSMKDLRNSFYTKVLVPPYGNTVADNIVNDILKVVRPNI